MRTEDGIQTVDVFMGRKVFKQILGAETDYYVKSRLCRLATVSPKIIPRNILSIEWSKVKDKPNIDVKATLKVARGDYLLAKFYAKHVKEGKVVVPCPDDDCSETLTLTSEALGDF